MDSKLDAQRISVMEKAMKTRLLMICIIGAIIVGGCSCGKSNENSVEPSGNETSRSVISETALYPFNAFKEVRFDIVPETPVVGEIVTINAVTVPIDDYASLKHPWIDIMRSDSPNFTVEGYPYRLRTSISISGDGMSKCTDNMVLAVISEQHNAVYKVANAFPGEMVCIETHNLVFGKQEDTTVIRMRFSNAGGYAFCGSYRIQMPRYHGGFDHVINGADNVTDKIITVRQR